MCILHGIVHTHFWHKCVSNSCVCVITSSTASMSSLEYPLVPVFRSKKSFRTFSMALCTMSTHSRERKWTVRENRSQGSMEGARRRERRGKKAGKDGGGGGRVEDTRGR